MKLARGKPGTSAGRQTRRNHPLRRNRPRVPARTGAKHRLVKPLAPAPAAPIGVHPSGDHLDGLGTIPHRRSASENSSSQRPDNNQNYPSTA